MRYVCLTAFALLASPLSLAQTPEEDRWIGGKTGISVQLPPGWLPETKDTPSGMDVIHRPSSVPGGTENACMLSKMTTGGVGPDGKPLTQERINRESAPLTADMALLIAQRIGFKNVTWIEALPTTIVDGKAALSFRAMTPQKPASSNRMLLVSANVLGPTMLYTMQCIFPLTIPPNEEPDASLATPTDEFQLILKSIRTG